MTKYEGKKTFHGRDELGIKVPASTANLGPGFDALGLALTLHNEFRVSLSQDQASYIENQGYGEDLATLAEPTSNLFFKAYTQTCATHSLPNWPLNVKAFNRIPLNAGIGSSASAIIAGVLAAYALHGREIDKRLILQDALALEAHPDNLSACLYGGFTIAVLSEKGPLVHKTKLTYPLRCWVIYPQQTLKDSTQASRARLAPVLKREDAIYSLGRAAFLSALLIKGEENHLAELSEVMKDKIHEPLRMDPYMEYPVLKAQLQGPEFYGWAVSGSGPAIVIFCKEITPRLQKLVKDYFAAKGVAYVDFRLHVDNEGALVHY